MALHVLVKPFTLASMKSRRLQFFLTIFLGFVLLQGNAITSLGDTHASTMVFEHCEQQTQAVNQGHCEGFTQTNDTATHDNCCQSDCQCQALCLAPMLGTAFAQAITPFTPIQQHFPDALLMAIKAPVFYRPPIYA